MKKNLSVLVAISTVFLTFIIILASFHTFAQDKNPMGPTDVQLALLISSSAAPLYSNSKQMTFVGPRSGEGYYSADGNKMVFQSEREPGNPFYQMYILDLISGKTTRISTGTGKTTCGWIHPNMEKVMWSSTHLDKNTNAKVKAEYEERAKPVKGRYSWSFDEEFDIFESNLNGQQVKRLTKEKGYDAEGSYSPDGKWIAFASNRSLYTDSFKDNERKILDRDPSYAMEIYIMKADGSGVKRLTHSAGYDGGPFFSADGKKITWRRFTPDGSKAEIFTMNVDGTDQKAVTKLGSMSWAPFYHPSGDYIIFASSVLGYANFELFIVDSAGTQKPVRVTTTDGFDGLASFSPDGQKLTWSHRNEKGESQIYIADWNDAEARKALQLPPAQTTELHLGKPLTIENLKNSIQYLASERLNGRATGSEEEKEYTRKIAELFKTWGLKPVLGKSFIQPFEFTSGVKASEKNTLELKGRVTKKLERSEDYQVLSYSKSGSFPAAPLVFAGYGIKASATGKLPAFDSYQDLNVKDKWVLVLDGQPRPENKEWNHHLLTFSRAQHKITVAKNLGALGVIFISDHGLKSLKFEGSLSETTMPVLKISEALFFEIVKASDQSKQFDSLKNLKDSFESLKVKEGFPLNSQYLTAEVDLQIEKSVGHNVIGRLDPVVKSTARGILVGAHGDHLGQGVLGSSLANADEKTTVHFGADDNASGVAGVLELAQFFAKKENQSEIKKPIYFAVWSGEEIGVLGSNSFVKSWEKQNKRVFRKGFEASLNMDMIGRLRDSLQVQGVGSAKEWTGLSEEVGLITGQNLNLTHDPYLPTDSMTFYLAQIPSITFFTGAHSEYHSPRDTAATINYSGLLKVISVVKSYIQKLATVKTTQVQYAKVEGNTGQKLEGRSFRIFLGTIPDYSQEGVKGVRISGASKNSPAEKAGLVAHDIIVEFDQTKIENLYDYVYTLQSVKPGKPTKIKISRGTQIIELPITPVLKE